jgi:hypothetical protein
VPKQQVEAELDIEPFGPLLLMQQILGVRTQLREVQIFPKANDLYTLNPIYSNWQKISVLVVNS